jgi:hypothetical protein
MAFFEWVRTNSEHYLMEASQREMAKKYMGTEPPVIGSTVKDIFFRRLFVHIYRLLPYKLTKLVMMAMPGSHHKDWGSRPHKS